MWGGKIVFFEPHDNGVRVFGKATATNQHTQRFERRYKRHNLFATGFPPPSRPRLPIPLVRGSRIGQWQGEPPAHLFRMFHRLDLMSSDFYDQHLRTFPQIQPLFTADSVPSLGSVHEFLRLFETRLGCDVTLVRAGGEIPEETVAVYPITTPPLQGEERHRTVGHLAISPASESSDSTAASREQCCHSLASLLAELYHYADALRYAHSQLALPLRIPAAVLVEQRLAETLQHQLQTAVRLVGANAASLYTLSNPDRTLALRSSFGLPADRFLDLPRSLYDAAADLEAMLGYAVIINEEVLHETWQSPEPFSTAVCVPVSTSTSILGTAWFYYDRTLDITDHNIDILEMTVGRIAAELERVAAVKAIKAA